MATRLTDIAIWIHPTDPALSTIIGTDKRPGGGLMVYDLDGNLLQFVDVARMNNVDLRYNFPLNGEPTAIVVATNRDDNGLSVFRVNPETRQLEQIDAHTITTELDRVDGVCMYHSAVNGKYYAFVTSPNNGAIEQYELFDNGSGQVEGTRVRQFVVGSQTEGCVADDELGNLFLSEELVGLWRYGAEPDAGEERVLVDSTGEDGHLTPDVEGSTIYYGSDGTGYLIVSSQGSNEYVIYAREGDNAYIGTFRIVDSELVDGASNTDGVDVTNFPLGGSYAQGLFVTQDGENVNPDANQDFKLLAWSDIAAAFGLTIDTTHDPRAVGLP
ncbi:MAG: phytase [Anaerolineae bacterium]